MPDKPKPTGKPINWTAADLDRLAEITPEDVASAKAMSERLAPKRLRGMLKAKKPKRG